LLSFSFYLRDYFNIFSEGEMMLNMSALKSKDQKKPIHVSNTDLMKYFNQSSSFSSFMVGKNKRMFNSLGNESDLTTTNKHANFLMNKKALKSIFLLLIGFFICWTPLLVYFIYYACETDYNDLAVYVVMFLAAFNSIINPILYSLNDREVLRKRQRSSTSSSFNT
jgi:hypothetical protein